MSDKDRQIESLIREFKSNELEYEDRICELTARNKILELEVEELKTFINIYRTKDREAVDREDLVDLLEEMTKRVISSTQAHADSIIYISNDKITALLTKLSYCETKIEMLKKSSTLLKIEDLKKQLSYKNNYIQTQNELIDKVINQKSESEAIFNRQFKFLEKLANEKKELCNRLEEINTYLMEENTQLKKQREGSRKSSVLEGNVNHREINLSGNHDLGRVTKTKEEVSLLLADEGREGREKTSKLSISNMSKAKISVHLDRKLLSSKEKKAQLPFSEIKNSLA